MPAAERHPALIPWVCNIDGRTELVVPILTDAGATTLRYPLDPRQALRLGARLLSRMIEVELKGP